MPSVTVIVIDPGSQNTGWGVVRESSGVLQLVDCGVVRSTAKGATFSERLARIYHEISQMVARLQPQEAAIEQVFTAQNAVSALKLGQARGAAVAACAAHNIPVFDYAPTLVKKSLVGTGRAEKEQTAFMVQRLLNVRNAHWALDTSDALAVAICHLTSRRLNAITMR